MADENTEGTAPDGAEPDYKSLYEQARAHSREWERKAKANKSAADELKAAQEAGKTAEDRIAELTKRLDDAEREKARRETAAKVAAAKGVPADLIVGDDEEAMAAWADRLIAEFRPKAAPKVEKAGSFAKSGSEGADDGMRDVLHRLFDEK